jgi:hypothetical protein
VARIISKPFTQSGIALGGPLAYWAQDVLLVLVFIAFPSPGGVVQGCKKGYDVSGPYTVPVIAKPGVRDLIYNKTRAFVWSHWHQRRPGCATLTTTNTAEFVKCTKSYIIEPEKGALWHIDEQTKCGPAADGSRKAKAERTIWYSVRRVAKSDAGGRANEPLPDSADAPAGSYVLILSDRSGRKSREL